MSSTDDVGSIVLVKIEIIQLKEISDKARTFLITDLVSMWSNNQRNFSSRKISVCKEREERGGRVLICQDIVLLFFTATIILERKSCGFDPHWIVTLARVKRLGLLRKINNLTISYRTNK